VNELINFITLHLTGMGTCVLVVWPATGPVAWVRDSIFRKLIPSALVGVLDCYICFSFWSGLAWGVLWWWLTEFYWCLAAPLTTPALFWIVLQFAPSLSDTES
jgi:hypothetical protein